MASPLVPGVAEAVPPAAGPAETHCVIHITGQLRSGQFLTDNPTCYKTLSDARGAVAGATAKASGGVQLLTVTLATHFDGASYAGASLTVTGASCSANGWINMNATWNNKISSTLSDCTVNHYDGFNLTGASEAVFSPGGNLATAMNNRTSSALYAS